MLKSSFGLKKHLCSFNLMECLGGAQHKISHGMNYIVQKKKYMNLTLGKCDFVMEMEGRPFDLNEWLKK